jgi:hypothetical protein
MCSDSIRVQWHLLFLIGCFSVSLLPKLKPYHAHPRSAFSCWQELSYPSDVQATEEVTAPLADVTVLRSLKAKRSQCNKQARATKRGSAPREQEPPTKRKKAAKKDGTQGGKKTTEDRQVRLRATLELSCVLAFSSVQVMYTYDPIRLTLKKLVTLSLLQNALFLWYIITECVANILRRCVCVQKWL